VSESEYLEQLLEATLKIADWSERTEKARQEVEARRAAQLEEIMRRQSALLETLRSTIKNEARLATDQLQSAIGEHKDAQLAAIAHHADRTVPQLEELPYELDDDDDEDDGYDCDTVSVIATDDYMEGIPSPTDQAFWSLIGVQATRREIIYRPVEYPITEEAGDL
jgi:hypothetical protein